MTALAEILNRELDLFNEFLDLLDKQHQQLNDGDFDGLNETTRELDRLSVQADIIEQDKNRSVEEACRLLNPNRRMSADTKLGCRINNINGKQFEKLRKTILAVHGQIEAKSLRNMELVEKTRQLLETTFRQNRKGQKTPVFFGENADMNSRHPERILPLATEVSKTRKRRPKETSKQRKRSADFNT